MVTNRSTNEGKRKKITIICCYYNQIDPINNMYLSIYIA